MKEERKEDLMFHYDGIVTDEDTARPYLDALYDHIVKNDISNIYICSNDKIVIDRNKNKVAITEKPLTQKHVKALIMVITGGVGGDTQILSGVSLDRAQDFRVVEPDENGEYARARFRINIMRVYHMEQDGAQITIRKIDFNPPALNKISFSEEEDMYKNFFKEQGLSLVTGPTGSGKSTTLAAFIQNHLMKKENHIICNTYEEPIEYVHDYTNKNSPNSRVYQTEVPTGIASFEKALEKSLRRQPEMIMIGELRDTATISAAIEAGLTGHLVMSTTHTNGVAATVKRLVTIFPAGERESRQIDIIEQLNIIIAQRLLRTVDGKKVAVREHLVFTDEIKDRLQLVNPLHLNAEVRKIMNEKKQGMLFEAKELYDNKVIDRHEYMKIASIYKDEYKKAKEL